jgi:hypothetical protein
VELGVGVGVFVGVGLGVELGIGKQFKQDPFDSEPIVSISVILSAPLMFST